MLSGEKEVVCCSSFRVFVEARRFLTFQSLFRSVEGEGEVCLTREQIDREQF
jgi:hypothetical protein